MLTATTGTPNNTPVVNGFDSNALIYFGNNLATKVSCGGATCTVISPATSVAGPVSITAANVFSNGTIGPVSSTSSAATFLYQAVQAGSFSKNCPPGENGVPPNYTLVTPTPSDFYTWSGTPINSVTPPPAGLQYLSTGSVSTGPMYDEPVFVAACPVGMKTDCTSYNLDTTWCYSNKPPPPPPPPPPLSNCKICSERGQQCVKVSGGYQCKGTIQ